MAQTFTNMDVFTANTYSKAVLRVAGQMLTARFPFVDYFPSYEMVMNSPRAMTWADDQVHVALHAFEQEISRFPFRSLVVANTNIGAPGKKSGGNCEGGFA